MKMNEFSCNICGRNFKDKDALDMHSNAKHPELVKKPLNIPFKKIRNWSIFIIVIGLIIFGVYYILSQSDRLPPIDIKGHVEANPDSHILKEPMPIAIQKHMLEHVDGKEGGRGGVIINY